MQIKAREENQSTDFIDLYSPYILHFSHQNQYTLVKHFTFRVNVLGDLVAQ